MSAFYDLKAELSSGQPLAFEDLKGKVVLVVNVASQCGFTPQYKGLQALYDKYKVGSGCHLHPIVADVVLQEKDFVILGFPCNQVRP
jgi:glutathione peroxidase-family protein